MRVDLANTVASQISSERTAENAQARQEVGSLSSDHEDRTTFSSQTESVGSLIQTAMSSSEVRQEKVESLRNAIASGKYEVDPAKIAQSMIDEHA